MDVQQLRLQPLCNLDFANKVGKCWNFKFTDKRISNFRMRPNDIENFYRNY